MTLLIELTATLVEVGRVCAVLSRVEGARRREGLRAALVHSRRRGRASRRRSLAARLRLRRAIGWVDARMPGGSNCYRRALLEIALDGGAAGDPLLLGFNLEEQLSGHAWLAGQSDASAYQFTVRL